jgi:hypothetical protein
MDRELSDAFTRQEQTTERGFARVERQIETLTASCHQHFLEDARAFARVEDSARSANARLDEHLEVHTEERNGRARLWIGVVIAFASGAWGVVASWFRSKSKGE